MSMSDKVIFKFANTVELIRYQLEVLADECGSINESLTKDNFFPDMLEKIGYVLSDLYELQKILSILVKKFDPPNVILSRFERYFNQVKRGLLKQQLKLVGKINGKVNIVWSAFYEEISLLSFIWDEKILEYASDIQVHILDSLGSFIIDNKYQFFPENGRDGLDSSENLALKAMLENAQRAEKVFFSLNRHPEYATLVLVKNEIKSKILKKEKLKKSVDFNLLNGRKLIGCYSQAIADNLEGVATKDLSHQGFFRVTEFHAANEISIEKGYVHSDQLQSKVTIFSSFRPFRGHVGNQLVKGVKKYGDSDKYDILSVLNAITREDPEHEKQLARLFLQYKSGKPDAFSYQSLSKVGISFPQNKKNDDTIKRLYKIAYLFCFVEVIRRMNPGYKDDYKVLELPFNTGIVCALVLIYQGRLKMRDVFTHDSLYGVVTGEKIVDHANVNDTINKFNRLFKLFLKMQEEIFAEECLSELICDSIDISLFPYAPTEAIFLALFAHVDEGLIWVPLPVNDIAEDENQYNINTGISSAFTTFKI